MSILMFITCMKLLVLVIASLDKPYSEFLELWRSRVYPEWVSVKYIFMNPALTQDIEINGDSIHVKGEESIIPGIWDKTRAAMRICFETEEFEYILRSNLSSFYKFDKMYSFLQSIPREDCVAGKMMWEGQFLSGCGYLMSRDVVEKFLEWPFSHYPEKKVYDDIEMGYFMKYHRFTVALWDIDEYDPVKGVEGMNAFHLRFCYDVKDRAYDLNGYREAIERFDSLPVKSHWI